MAKIGLSSPWTIFYREIDAMFKFDPDVHVIYDEETPAIKLYVENAAKAWALERLLPTEKTFGNITLPITVIPANDPSGTVPTDCLHENAFCGNPAVRFIRMVRDVFDMPYTFVIFTREVVQYFSDDLGDFNGIHSTLYEDIARDIFIPQAGVFYCTDTEEGLQANQDFFTMPLGEWP